jgi:hypothetical protein
MSGLTYVRCGGLGGDSISDARDPIPGRHLLIASTGGHLAELERWSNATGSDRAVGVVGLAAPRLHRVPAFFFESVSRVDGPTLSGRLAGLDPGITRFCQYGNWAKGRWAYSPLSRERRWKTLDYSSPWERFSPTGSMRC